MLVGGNLESTSTRHDSLILDGVAHSTETIAYGILCLSDGIVIGTLNEDCAREWVLNSLNKRVLLIS